MSSASAVSPAHNQDFAPPATRRFITDDVIDTAVFRTSLAQDILRSNWCHYSRGRRIRYKLEDDPQHRLRQLPSEQFPITPVVSAAYVFNFIAIIVILELLQSIPQWTMYVLLFEPIVASMAHPLIDEFLVLGASKRFIQFVARFHDSKALRETVWIIEQHDAAQGTFTTLLALAITNVSIVLNYAVSLSQRKVLLGTVAAVFTLLTMLFTYFTTSARNEIEKRYLQLLDEVYGPPEQ